MAKHSARFTHIGLPVTKLDRSIEFYERWTSLKVEAQSEQPFGISAARLANRHGFVLSLFEAPTAAPLTGLAHLGMALGSRDDVDNLASEAKSEGVLIFGPVDSGNELGYQAFLADPDGNSVEFSFGQQMGLAQD